MKVILSTLVAFGTLTACTVVLAASPRPIETTVCSAESKSAEVPSGTYTDSHGRKWAGFKSDGTPPDGLTTDSTSISCTTTITYPPFFD